MHTSFRTSIVAMSAAIMGVACSTRQADSTSPDINGDRLGNPAFSGAWVHTAIGPVYRESMTLSHVGAHVTGTGTYAIEAGRSGPTTIDGTVSGSTLTLTITRDYGLVESFTGKLTGATHLIGTLDIDGVAQDFAYAKQ